jgi:ribosomal subunit interface protein
MKIMISGKHVDIGESLSAHIEHRLEEGINKYLDRVTSVNVVVTKEAHMFRVDINGNTGTASGVIIKSSANAGDVYACFDAAAEKIEKQLRRYKRRLTNHHKQSPVGAAASAMGTLGAKKYVLKPEEEASDAPVVIAEKATAIERLSVSEAVMKMDLADLPALMFFNSANGRINVVYRRTDGNISWVDPEDKAA